MKLFKMYLNFYKKLKALKNEISYLIDQYWRLEKKYNQCKNDLKFAKECIKQCSDYADGNPYLAYYIVPEEKLLGIRRVTDEAILRLGE